jgi:hypothetical protein
MDDGGRSGGLQPRLAAGAVYPRFATGSRFWRPFGTEALKLTQTRLFCSWATSTRWAITLFPPPPALISGCPSADEDTWQARKFGPTMIPRNFVYDAALTYSYVLPQMIEPNNNVNPLRLTITFYNGETRLATVVNSWDRASAGRKVKILAYHDITVPASAAGVWAYTDALRDMANHLGTLARCGKGW